MNIDKAKHLINGLYDISLNCDCDDLVYHPIRIIESSKSIIGINPDRPEVKLLDYCERYISSFKHRKIKADFSEVSMPAVVTFLDLELSIKEKNKELSRRNLYYLSRVSDGTHILEFLLEFSLKYCSVSFLLIWSVYRMHLFLGLDNILKSLLVCLECILIDVDKKRKGMDLDVDDLLKKCKLHKDSFECFFSLYRIAKNDFVRNSTIQPLVVSIMNEKFLFSNNKNNLILNKDQKSKGRSWILDFFSKIDEKKIDNDLILNMDSARGVLKALNGSNEELVWGRLNKFYGIK